MHTLNESQQQIYRTDWSSAYYLLRLLTVNLPRHWDCQTNQSRSLFNPWKAIVASILYDWREGKSSMAFSLRFLFRLVCWAMKMYLYNGFVMTRWERRSGVVAENVRNNLLSERKSFSAMNIAAESVGAEEYHGSLCLFIWISIWFEGKFVNWICLFSTFDVVCL